MPYRYNQQKKEASLVAKTEKTTVKNLPIGKNEDVEYKASLADVDDLEAQARAQAADRRATDSR